MDTPSTFYPQGPLPEAPPQERHYPLTSLVASARRITTTSLAREKSKMAGQPWQADAWDMYDLVGELRYLTNVLANRMGQARLFVGRLPDALTAEPVEVSSPVEANESTGEMDLDPDAVPGTAAPAPEDEETGDGPIEAEVLLKVLESFGRTPTARAQLLSRLGLNLLVAGEGWVVGIPEDVLEEALETTEARSAGGRITVVDRSEAPEDLGDVDADEDVNLDEIEWRVLSTEEVSAKENKTVEIHVEEDVRLSVSPDDIYIFRVWKSHPRRAWEADSPTRSTLPPLREIVSLSMHVAAATDSRLAGAGLLIVPQSASDSIRRAAGLPDVPSDNDPDPFTDALIEAMVTPILDRSSASAIVPLVITVPDLSVEAFKHITFDTPLDAEINDLRDAAIRRFALGQDAPPELLSGTGGMNHWGAWLVQEDVVKSHLVPPLSLLCDALTTQFLWPMLEAMGYKEDDVRQYVIWHDVEHLIVRPNRSTEAKGLYDAGVISPRAYRDAAGFHEEDAPTAELEAAQAEKNANKEEDDAIRKAAGVKAIELAIANPQLVIAPGLQAIAQQVYEVMVGAFTASDDIGQEPAPLPEDEDSDEEEDAEEAPADRLPTTDSDDAAPPSFASAGV